MAGLLGDVSPAPPPSGSPTPLDGNSQSLPRPWVQMRDSMDLLQKVTCFSLIHPFNKNVLRVSPIPSTMLGVGAIATTKTDRMSWSSPSKGEISFLGGQCQAQGGFLSVLDEDIDGGSVYNHSRSELGRPRWLSSVPHF